MKNASFLAIVAFVVVVSACGSPEKENTTNQEPAQSMVEDAPPAYDSTRGQGKWTEENINLGESLNQEWVTSGENISNTKCTSCHKLTHEKLVGPGWEGVTTRRKPEWIMNFITNPDPMIDKDPNAQAMLELCLVRMPNQNLSDGEARNIFEFMRKNDGVK